MQFRLRTVIILFVVFAGVCSWYRWNYIFWHDWAELEFVNQVTGAPTLNFDYSIRVYSPDGSLYPRQSKAWFSSHGRSLISIHAPEISYIGIWVAPSNGRKATTHDYEQAKFIHGSPDEDRKIKIRW